MDKAEAKILVKAYAATDNEPTLNDGEIDIILSQARRPASDGTLLNETG